MGLFKAQMVLFMGGYWTVMLISFFEYPSCHFGAQWFNDIHKSIMAHSGHNALDACKLVKKKEEGGVLKIMVTYYTLTHCFSWSPLLFYCRKKPSLWFHRGGSEIIDRVCLSGWCSSREWEGQEEKRGGGNTRPSVISWPCEGALVFLHHHKEKDSGLAQSIQGGAGWGVEFRADWCYTASQLGVGVCYNCRGTSPSAFFLSVCEHLKRLFSSSHCWSSGCSSGCVAQMWETLPYSYLLSWLYTMGVNWGIFFFCKCYYCKIRRWKYVKIVKAFLEELVIWMAIVSKENDVL